MIFSAALFALHAEPFRQRQLAFLVLLEQLGRTGPTLRWRPTNLRDSICADCSVPAGAAINDARASSKRTLLFRCLSFLIHNHQSTLDKSSMHKHILPQTLT